MLCEMNLETVNFVIPLFLKLSNMLTFKMNEMIFLENGGRRCLATPHRQPIAAEQGPQKEMQRKSPNEENKKRQPERRQKMTTTGRMERRVQRRRND